MNIIEYNKLLMSDYKKSQFDYNKITENTRIKMAFIGNSKVGKTSLINTIVGNNIIKYDKYEKTIYKTLYTTNYNIIDSSLETNFIDKVKELDLKTVELQMED